MSTPAPTWLAALDVVAVCGVTAARWWLVDDTVAHRLINRALMWLSLGVTAAQFGFWFGATEICYQIFLALCPPAMANVYGLAQLLIGADPETASLRQRRYDIAALLAGAAILLIGQPMDHTGSEFWWRAAIYWLIFNVPALVAGALLARACVRELRLGAGPRELFAYGGLVTLAVGWYFSAVLGLSQIRAQIAPGGPPVQWGVLSCAFGILVAVVTAVPLVNLLLARIGWDRTGRDLRRLHSLWVDLTDAVPEIAMPAVTDHSDDPPARLYRMAVEIRDALLHLHRYVPPEQTAETSSVARYAHVLAGAAHRKTTGAPPTGSTPADRIRPVGRDLSADLGHLLELSREWPRARAMVVGADQGRR
ncbi:MAB_1171c family putative transporter [Nocardia sp. NPDC050710]|uniref:MAB_1171c family putative transporter n=1 Tax=Nocardia sp. NPDC050710 TaxID=3157220 RepID=UPI0033D51809